MNVIVSPMMINPDTYDPVVKVFAEFNKVFAEFKIQLEAQQDGHGPFPTFADKVDKALASLKAEILGKKIS